MTSYADMLDLAREYGTEYASTNPGQYAPLNSEWSGDPTPRTVCERVSHACTAWHPEADDDITIECNGLSYAFEDAYYNAR